MIPLRGASVLPVSPKGQPEKLENLLTEIREETTSRISDFFSYDVKSTQVDNMLFLF